MQAFIISLERERARRKESIRLIRLSGLPFELIEAVDGRVTSNLPRSPGGWQEISNTEVACYLSHLRALQRIVDYDLPYAMILEDDFDYRVGVTPGLAEIEPLLPPDFDYVCLHDIRGELFEGYTVAEQCPPFQRLVTPPLVALGYIVSRKLAAHILKERWLPYCPFDHVVIHLSNDRCWGLYDLIDPVLRARSVPSTIR